MYLTYLCSKFSQRLSYQLKYLPEDGVNIRFSSIMLGKRLVLLEKCLVLFKNLSRSLNTSSREIQLLKLTYMN